MPKTKDATNWPLVGNEKVGNFLLKSLLKGSLSGAYIFSGPGDLGKTTAAKFFAKVLLCENVSKPNAKLPCEICPSCKKMDITPRSEGRGKSGQDGRKGEVREKEKIDLSGRHGDLLIIKKDPEKKNISIGQIREFIRRMSLGSFLGNYKVGIIKDADYLSQEASNALLKILEEPKKKVVIILTAADLDKILPTIISRCQVLNFSPVKASLIHDYLIKERGIGRSQAKNLSRLSLGRPALALKFLEGKNFQDEYLKVAGSFLRILPADLNERLREVDGCFKKKETGQDLVKSAERILDIWQGLARDLILEERGLSDLIQHEALIDEIRAARKHLDLLKLTKLLAQIKRGREYINANVNPKLVLEEIVINI
ncbi:MAG: hypothetical protein WCW77_02350 [Patescibacteria group bacterium]|jgi:DNA polymerase-3 subunit delta'